MKTGRSLRELFSFPDFVAAATLRANLAIRRCGSCRCDAEKTAVCSHCGHRCSNRYDQRLCRARDLRGAGWVLHVEFERWRVNCRAMLTT